ncbi:MAG: transglutaminase domain-containing protein [Gemmataceae bacterium]
MNRFQIVLLCVVAALLAESSSARAGARDVKVTTDQTIDNSSLEAIVRDVFARSGAKTNDEKAIALYEYLHQAIFLYAYPTESKPQSVGPLKMINVYGWGLCGGQHTVLKALFETAGWKCRYVGWDGHTTIEVYYDDRWHYFDVFLKCYYWSKDKSHVVSQDEIAADASIVRDAVKEGRAARQNLCCGDTIDGVISGIKTRKVVGDSKGWASVTWRDQNYRTALDLPAGAALKLEWKAEKDGFATTGKPPVHTCGNKDFRLDAVLGPLFEHYGPRGFATGSFIYQPDFSKPADVADLELKNVSASDGKLVANGNGSVIFKLPLPYAWVSGQVDAVFAGGKGQLALSTDGGKTWSDVPGGKLDGLVKQHYDVWLKADFTGKLEKLRVDAAVEHNRGSLPYLVVGKNKITVSTEKNELPRGASLVVTYTYQEATAPAKRQRYDGNGVKYGEVKTVTKEITSLPYSFEIEVGGNTPPKMLALERKIAGK